MIDFNSVCKNIFPGVISILIVGIACLIWTPIAIAQEGELSADETANKLGRTP